MNAEAGTNNQPEEHREPPYQGNSIRWKHFYAAFNLAAKKVSMQWDYAEFSECFPIWINSKPSEANVIHRELCEMLSRTILTSGQEMIEEYQAAERIDILHQVINEARAQKASGVEPGKDIWSGNLEPKAAVRSRTVPVLRQERDRLKALLTEVTSENERLNSVLIENKEKRLDNDKLANQWLNALEEAAAVFSAVPEEEIVQWAIDVEETEA